MGSNVAAEAAADEVHALQGQGIEEALKGAAEGVKRVKGGGLRRNDVISFGAQRTQLPEEVGAGAACRPDEHNGILRSWAAAVVPPFLQRTLQQTMTHGSPFCTRCSGGSGSPWYLLAVVHRHITRRRRVRCLEVLEHLTCRQRAFLAREAEGGADA